LFLKSLTIRGFKSFADKTVLAFKPGTNVIVGPNGSGKSNVVDAIAWVLGEQGPRALRGGKMEDVIFAGSPRRPSSGRAEVELVIDNSSGLLPIEYTEVRISRLLFRSGESEYAINGTACRLLDIQELLSDTGVGRELHTIVGQGQLEEILQARPEQRRLMVEEAAGIIKFRRRKERALRKLATVEQHLVRLSDVVGELRRQLRPLEQQAETARRAADLEAKLRWIRLALLRREHAELRSRVESRRAAEQELEARHRELEERLARLSQREAALDQDLKRDSSEASNASEVYFRLAGLRERFRGMAELASQLSRHLEQPPVGQGTLRPEGEDLEAEAVGLRELIVEVAAERAMAHQTLEAAMAERHRVRLELVVVEEAVAGSERALAERRERVLALRGEVTAIRGTLERAAAEWERLAATRREIATRRAKLQIEDEEISSAAVRQEEAEAGLSAALDRAQEALATRQAAVDGLLARRSEFEREVAFWQARREALLLAADEGLVGKGAEALLAEKDGLAGAVEILGRVIDVAEGYGPAVAAALGADAGAVIVPNILDAARALELLKSKQAGRATFLSRSGEIPPRGQTPEGSRPLLDFVKAPSEIATVVARELARTYVVDDLETAAALAAAHPGDTFVTMAGELARTGRLEGGVPVAASGLHARVIAEEAAGRCSALEDDLKKAVKALAGAQQGLEEVRSRVEAASAALNEFDAVQEATAEQLGRLRQDLRSLAREDELLAAEQTKLTAARQSDEAHLEALQARLEVAEGEAVAPAGASMTEIPAELTAAAGASEAREVEARVTLGALVERERNLAQRLARSEQAVAALAAGREREAVLAADRADAARRARGLGELVVRVLARLEASLAGAAAERDARENSRRAHESGISTLRAERKGLETEIESVRAGSMAGERVHAEDEVRLDHLTSRLVEEFEQSNEDLAAEIDAEALAGELGLPEGTSAEQAREEAVREVSTIERRLGLLGRVNPLALEEFEALAERHTFLSGQLEDLRESRRDLHKVIKAVDDKMREVFEGAFADVAAEFARTFAILFPEGEGGLYLTDPENPLEAGVEIEARPPGKKVKRLSLLSGGERSLVALAFLFALYRARPSPFYLLDEVEAALDDINLHRFLDLLGDTRDSAQLLVVTHQKRTMEVADYLYGVSIGRDGVSKVLSYRVSDMEDVQSEILAQGAE